MNSFCYPFGILPLIPPQRPFYLTNLGNENCGYAESTLHKFD